MFNSRTDYERVVKLLISELDGCGWVGDHDSNGSPVIRWTAVELENADRYLLDVTQRPGVSSNRAELPAELELRLIRDTGWSQ